MEFILFFLINVIRILKYAILVRILLSWIQPGHPGRLIQILYEITEPILRIFRKILPRTGMLDFSPLLAFFALDFAQIGIISLFSGF
ncbi:YggT family protein [Candidatus Peregrinibacteria bacterium]|nr:YggT family protein [Candidatus Peregrinibacteria bacterium]